MDGKEETQVISARVRAPVANRMKVLLLTKGYEEAERQLTVLNNTFATEEWWPQVYRDVQAFLNDYLFEQKLRRMEEQQKLLADQQRQREDQLRFLLGGVHITNMMTGCNNEETSVSGNMFNVNNNKEVSLNG